MASPYIDDKPPVLVFRDRYVVEDLLVNFEQKLHIKFDSSLTLFDRDINVDEITNNYQMWKNTKHKHEPGFFNYASSEIVKIMHWLSNSRDHVELTFQEYKALVQLFDEMRCNEMFSPYQSGEDINARNGVDPRSKQNRYVSQNEQNRYVFQNEQNCSKPGSYRTTSEWSYSEEQNQYESHVVNEQNRYVANEQNQYESHVANEQNSSHVSNEQHSQLHCSDGDSWRYEKLSSVVTPYRANTPSSLKSGNVYSRSRSTSSQSSYRSLNVNVSSHSLPKRQSVRSQSRPRSESYGTTSRSYSRTKSRNASSRCRSRSKSYGSSRVLCRSKRIYASLRSRTRSKADISSSRCISKRKDERSHSRSRSKRRPILDKNIHNAKLQLIISNVTPIKHQEEMKSHIQKICQTVTKLKGKIISRCVFDDDDKYYITFRNDAECTNCFYILAAYNKIQASNGHTSVDVCRPYEYYKGMSDLELERIRRDESVQTAAKEFEVTQTFTALEKHNADVQNKVVEYTDYCKGLVYQKYAHLFPSPPLHPPPRPHPLHPPLRLDESHRYFVPTPAISSQNLPQVGNDPILLKMTKN